MKIPRFIGQFYKFTTTKDGGGRITFEVGADSIHEILEIQRLNAIDPYQNFALAVAPVVPGSDEESSSSESQTL